MLIGFPLLTARKILAACLPVAAAEMVSSLSFIDESIASHPRSCKWTSQPTERACNCPGRERQKGMGAQVRENVFHTISDAWKDFAAAAKRRQTAEGCPQGERSESTSNCARPRPGTFALRLMDWVDAFAPRP